MKNLPESFNMFDAKAVKSKLCPLCGNTLDKNAYCNSCKVWFRVNYLKTFITIVNRRTTKSTPIK